MCTSEPPPSGEDPPQAGQPARPGGQAGGTQAEAGTRQASRQARPAREAKPTLDNRQGGETVPRHSSRPKATEAALLDPEAGRGPDGPGAADDEEAEGP